MKTQIIKAFIPAILAIVVLSVAHLFPTQPGIAKSCMRPDMPLGYALHEWKGVKTQESELERKILSPDTQFTDPVPSIIVRDNGSFTGVSAVTLNSA